MSGSLLSLSLSESRRINVLILRIPMITENKLFFKCIYSELILNKHLWNSLKMNKTLSDHDKLVTLITYHII